jgi:hypothetical protein
MRGEYQTTLPLAHAWHQQWQTSLASDDNLLFLIASQLATAYRFLGQYQQARELDEDILIRRRIFGDDHAETLASASNLAADLRALSEHA